ncbi:unnamed protein product [Staurois parvus]|uniref:Uncharacterized protein n=1 Tax=Staurois parvus TaxID=386267 RepID=A0ABN9B176_9NEOB|nr:unnamed protein product [Staurois parvus]
MHSPKKKKTSLFSNTHQTEHAQCLHMICLIRRKDGERRKAQTTFLHNADY